MEKPLQETLNSSIARDIYSTSDYIKKEFRKEISIVENLHIAPSENVLKHLLAQLNEGQEISA